MGNRQEEVGDRIVVEPTIHEESRQLELAVEIFGQSDSRERCQPQEAELELLFLRD